MKQRQRGSSNRGFHELFSHHALSRDLETLALGFNANNLSRSPSVQRPRRSTQFHRASRDAGFSPTAGIACHPDGHTPLLPVIVLSRTSRPAIWPDRLPTQTLAPQPPPSFTWPTIIHNPAHLYRSTHTFCHERKLASWYPRSLPNSVAFERYRRHLSCTLPSTYGFLIRPPSQPAGRPKSLCAAVS